MSTTICYSHRGKETFLNKLEENLNKTVKKCLSGHYDFVVPIESEGMALLIPFLVDASQKNLKPEIIPDTVLETLPTGYLTGKSGVALDASIFSGKKAMLTKEKIARLGAKELYSAAPVVFEECPQECRPDMPNQPTVLLDYNGYAWAKEWLIKRQLHQTFPLDGDHLIFVFGGENIQITQEIFERILRLEKSYLVSSPGDPTIRLTVDGIKLRDTSNRLGQWGIWFESVCKIRLFLDRSQPIINAIPIIYPAVPSGIKFEPPTCPYLKLLNSLCFKEMAEDGRRQQAETCYRCLSISFSTKVMADLLIQLFPRDLWANDKLRLEPHPVALKNCWLFAMRKPDLILKHSYDILRNKIKEEAEFEQLDLLSPMFVLDEQSIEVSQNEMEIHSDRPQLTPEVEVAFEITNWYKERQKECSDENLLDKVGISYSQLRHRLRNKFSPIQISRSFDKLLDEGMIRPRNVEIVNENAPANPYYLARGYQPGGEYTRRLLLGILKLF